MDSTTPESSEEFFLSLERSELQRRCKEQGIKANLATKDMARILFNLQQGIKTPMRYLKSQSGARPSTSARKSEVGGPRRRLSKADQDDDAEDTETERRQLQLSPERRESSPDEKQEEEDKGSAQVEELPSVQALELSGNAMQKGSAQQRAAAGFTDDTSVPEKPAVTVDCSCPYSQAARSVAHVHEKQEKPLDSTDTALDSAGTDVAEAAVTAAAGGKEQSNAKRPNPDVGGSQVSPLPEGFPLPLEDRSGHAEAGAQGAKASGCGDFTKKQRDEESTKVGSTAGAEPPAPQAMGRVKPEESDVAEELVRGKESEATEPPVAQDSQSQAIAPLPAVALPSQPPSASPAPPVVPPASVATPATPTGSSLVAAGEGAVLFGAVGPSESLVGKMLEAERRNEEERSKPLTTGRTPLKSLMLANQEHMRKERMKAREDQARKQREAQIQASRGIGTPARCAALPGGTEHHTDAANGAGNSVTTPAMQGQS